MATIIGTLIPDLIIPNALLQGQLLPDLEEDDVIEVLEGDDAVVAASGNDRVLANAGDDIVFGNSGNDTIEGDTGNDTIQAGRNEDLVFGGQDNDLLFGNMDRDSLKGGDGNDTLYGGKQDDRLAGELGDDLLLGDLGADFLEGGEGNDTFVIGRRPETPTTPSTGGSSPATADTFLDFRHSGDDRIRLDGGLKLTDLAISDDGNGNAILRDVGGTGDYLAIVHNISAAQLVAHPEWFGAPALPALPSVPTPPPPPASTVEFSAASFPGTEGESAIVTLTRSGNTSQPASINFTTTSLAALNPATAATDYTPVAQTVNFAIGQTSATVEIALLPDTEIDPDERISLVLTHPVGTTLGTQAAASLTIVDVAVELSDTQAPTTPKLVDGEVLVVDRTGTTGVFVQSEDNQGVATYAVTGEVEAITINTVTGELSVVDASKLTEKDRWEVEVTATDTAGNTSTGTVAIAATIDAALNAATANIGDGNDDSFNNAEDTVLVASGSYEMPILDESVTLRGANRGIAGTEVRSPESEIRNGVNFQGEPTRVTLDGFQFSDVGVDVSFAGSGVAIENNRIEDTNGSAIRGFTEQLLTNVSIRNNLIQNTATKFAAIDFSRFSGEISGNTLRNIGDAAGSTTDDGILFDRSSDLTLANNTLENISGSGIQLLGGLGGSSKIAIHNNRIATANLGAILTGGGIAIEAANHTDLSIEENHITNAKNGALVVFGRNPGTAISTTANIFDDADSSANGGVPASIVNRLAGQSILSQGNTLEDGSAIAIGNIAGVGATDIMF